MKVVLTCMALAALALGGCNAKEERGAKWGSGKPTGRYASAGLYAPSRLWEQLKREAEPTDPAAAVLRDDDIVVVIVDTRTGEVRQCGNLSGHCVGMNPWTHAAAPVLLTKHEVDLEREDAELQARFDVEARGKPVRR